MTKKVIKSGGHPSLCSFWRHIADKYGYLEPFGKNRAQPKTRQKLRRDFFDDACGIAQNLI